jgi:hypothetical protein
MLDLHPLRERVKVLVDDDWDEVELVARSMYMRYDNMDMFQAEAYALLAVLEKREVTSKVLH